MNIDTKVKKTILYDSHLSLGAKLIPFGGYYMPISYSKGITEEYLCVRNSVGLFDVSHMGEIYIHGLNAKNFLQNITINDINKIKTGQAQYSAMCYPNGGIIDDFILYRKQNGYLMVVNASNILKDYNWLSNNIQSDVKIENLSDSYSLIAIQGPKSRKVLNKLFNYDIDLPFYSFETIKFNGFSILLSRTGYTGELGFEIYGDDDSIKYIWDILIADGVPPAGLAARDILRMEMKYCLYGNDIDETTNPLEAGLSWITDLSKSDFIGKDSLLQIKNNKINRQLITFIMDGRGIPRKGYELYKDNEKIGLVTSGTQSPILKKGIGIGYIKVPFNKLDQEISVKIRDKFIEATIIKPPFIKNTSLFK